EVLKKRDDVGERFVKRRRVGTGWLHKEFALPVDQRMRCFVRNDVMRKTSEDSLAGKITAGIRVRGRKVAKDNSTQVAIVVGVRFLHRMGQNAQLATERIIFARTAKSPTNLSTERNLETTNRLARHRINHLLMKTRIGLARLQPCSQENRLFIEINRLVIHV